jgi:streptogramin lyase
MLFSLFVLPALTAFATPVLNNRAEDPFTLYELPTPLSGPCDLTRGPDGAIWGQDLLVNHFFRIDPDTGHIDEFPIPFTTPLDPNPIQLPGVLKTITDRTALSCAIRAGADGNIYAGNGLRNQLIRINPTSKKIDLFEPQPLNPLGDLFPFNDLYTAEDGIWVTQTTGNTYSFFSFENETLIEHQAPTPLALPVGVFVDSGGIIYISELLANKILTLDPKTQTVNEYPLPLPGQLPAAIRAEYEGYIYFSLFLGNGIGRINMETKDIDLFHTNQTASLSAEVTLDKYGAIWLSSFTSDVLARLDTKTLEFTYVALPNSLAQIGLPGLLGAIPPYVDVAINYGPGDALWFTGLTTNQVGKYDLSGLY